MTPSDFYELLSAQDKVLIFKIKKEEFPEYKHLTMTQFLQMLLDSCSNTQ